MLITLALYRPHYSFMVSVAFHYRVCMGIIEQQHYYVEMVLCVFQLNYCRMICFTALSA